MLFSYLLPYSCSFHPGRAEYGLSASVGPLSVGTLISGGDDYGMLKDSGSPVARCGVRVMQSRWCPSHDPRHAAAGAAHVVNDS